MPSRRPFSWTVRQEVASTISAALRWILQRVPFLTHFLVVLLALLGPIVCPRLCAFVLVGTHVVFVLCQTRTAYGIYAAWQGVKKHSLTDWALEWESGVKGAQHEVLNYRDVQHGIILPAYKEDLATLRETLDILASHPMASTNYWVCLGMEEREAGGVTKARAIVDGYRARGAFRDIDFSLHPGNIVGEAAGKSSNVNWAARFLVNRIPERHHSQSIITAMDADTAFAADFFLACAVKFALAPQHEQARMMFVPPIVFDRNCAEVPIFTRATDIFWSCAGIGGIYPSSQCKIPTSAYAVSMQLAEYCGYWDAGPEAIGEDLHFYCKALYETRGNVISVTVYSPASQCNVVGAPAKGPIANYVNDMKARWTQACRHLWGSLDWGYTWHRTLTGAFGPSQQSTAAYMALQTVESSPGSTCVGDEGMDVEATLLPPSAFDQRTPSPSGSTSTAYSVEEEKGEKVGQLDPPTVAPKPLHPRVSFAIDDDQEDVEELDERKQFMASGYVDDSAKPLRRAFRFIVLHTRLYEAHLMVAHVFVMMFVLTLLPAVVHRNGTISLVDPYSRKCTWAMCKHALQVTPFAATADLPSDLAPGYQPQWMMPDLILCAMNTARLLGALGILATIVMCTIHDFYHAEAAKARWARSDAVLASWRAAGSLGQVPTRYLGIRAHQLAERRWPRALLDYTAIPAGLLYGILPLLYAQLHHLTTNKMTYVVSAKGKNVVFPVSDEVLRRSVDARRSLDINSRNRRASSSAATVSPHTAAVVAAAAMARMSHDESPPSWLERTASMRKTKRFETKQGADGDKVDPDSLPMHHLRWESGT